MAYITEVTYTQTGSSNTDFLVTFPFIATTDIKVQLEGVTTSAFTIDQTGATKVVMTSAPSAGQKVRVFRDTDIDAIEATYSAGSSIRAADLNTNNTQLLYAAQEFGTLKEDDSVSFTLGNKGDINVNSSTDWVINNNAIELAMMTDNSVGTDELVNSSVTSAKLASATITASELSTNSVIEAKIASDAVTTNKIADNAVTVDKIPNNSITLAKLVTSIQSMFAPTGSVIWYGGGTAPTGYLKSNGDTIPNGSGTVQGVTADFSALYAVVGATLPDLRGEFVRGLDDGRGIDTGRNIKSTQASQNKDHGHSVTATSAVNTTNITGDADKISEVWGADGSAQGVFARHTGAQYQSDNTPSSTDTNDSGRLSIDASHTHTATVTVSQSNSGGTEARPRNVALLACIKY